MAYRQHRQGDDIRLSQIIGAHGVGGLRVQMGGLSMICAGLDHWYEPYTSTRPMLNIPFSREHVMIKEKRLQKFLCHEYRKLRAIAANHPSFGMPEQGVCMRASMPALYLPFLDCILW